MSEQALDTKDVASSCFEIEKLRQFREEFVKKLYRLSKLIYAITALQRTDFVIHGHAVHELLPMVRDMSEEMETEFAEATDWLAMGMDNQTSGLSADDGPHREVPFDIVVSMLEATAGEFPQDRAVLRSLITLGSDLGTHPRFDDLMKRAFMAWHAWLGRNGVDAGIMERMDGGMRLNPPMSLCLPDDADVQRL